MNYPMNNLFQHIEYLMLRHDCVIVPGLGAFIASVTPARFDMEKGIIIPPSRTVMFNQAVAIDDGLIANSYSRKHGISFEEARQVIIRESNYLIADLRSCGEVRCGRLGKLVLGEEGNIVFSPIHSASTLSEDLGYSPVALHEETETAAPVEPEPMPVDEVEEAPTEVDARAERKYYSLRVSKSFAKIAAVFILVTAVALTVILNPVPRDTREQRASVVPVEAFIPAPKAEAAVADTMPAVEDEDLAEADEEPLHYLIVATFSNSKEAEAYAEKFSSDEFPMTAIASRKMCRVYIASSDNREELRKKLNSRPIASRFPEAWIWTRN